MVKVSRFFRNNIGIKSGIVLLTLLCVLSCAKDIIDTTGKIKGVVKDQETGQLIANCHIALSPDGLSKSTGSEGQFEFENLEPGSYTLTFVKSGYEDVSKSLIIVAGKTSDIQIAMKPLGRISGIVKEQDSDIPVAGCQIALSPGNEETVSDKEGRFEFEDLVAGKYTLKLNKSGYDDESQPVTVSAGKTSDIQVAMEPLKGVLSVSEDKLEFGTSTSTLSLTLSNTGQGDLEWKAFEEADWFECTPQKGALNPSQTTTVVVTVNREGLKKGDYEESLVISSEGGSADVTITMTVETAEFAVSPSSLDFGAVETSLEVTMTNPMEKTLDYTISTTRDWLLVSKTSGKITTKESFNAIVSREGLSVNNYDANIIIHVSDEDISVPVKMKVVEKEKPAVSIEEIFDVTSNSVSVKATLKSVGSSKVIRHGVCWSKNIEPTMDNDMTNLGDCTGAKSFECKLSGLEPETKYYVRAYAENVEGVAYSQEKNFTTSKKPVKPEVMTVSVKDVAYTKATAVGKIESLGNVEKITAYGHVWGTTHEPSIVRDQYSDLGETKKSLEEYFSEITALEPATTYYVRSYATNSEGTSYGEDLTFTTKDYEVPKVSIGEAADIQTTSFTVGGGVISTGGTDLIEYGHCWSTSQNPTTSDSRTSLKTKIAAGTFESKVTGLSDSTVYYVRAYAVNAKGTSYSEEITVTTRAYTVPSVSIGQASDVQRSTFTIEGEILSTGGLTLTDYGHCWSTLQDPTVSDSKTSFGARDNEGNFRSDVTGLLEGTTYYVRSYAVNDKGVSYSESVEVTTSDGITDKLDGTVATSFAGGSGTSEDPYIIETGAQLRLMTSTDYYSKTFILANNIDLDNRKWEPRSFDGYLDGNDHTIKNLYVDGNSDNIGFFSILYGTVVNLTISGVRIEAGNYNNVGALAGDTYSRGVEVRNCKVLFTNGSKLVGKNNVGGLVGYIHRDYDSNRLKVVDCEVLMDENTEIFGEDCVGGIVGSKYTTYEIYGDSIAQCHFVGTIKAKTNIGGIVGCLRDQSIIGCSVSATISGQKYVGGILGYGSWRHEVPSISSSKAIINIVVEEGVAGGIVGHPGSGYYMLNVSGCYADGYICSPDSNCYDVGGIVGESYVREPSDPGFCYVSYSTVVSDLLNFKQLRGKKDYSCTGSYYSDNITETLKKYSNAADFYDFDNIWIWEGTVNGVQKSISCPKLFWEK